MRSQSGRWRTENIAHFARSSMLCPMHLVPSIRRGSLELCCSSAQGLGPVGTFSCKRGLWRGIMQTHKLSVLLCAEKKHFRPCQQDSLSHPCKNSLPKTCHLCPPAIALSCFRKMPKIQAEFNLIGQRFLVGYNTSSLKDFFFLRD